jgi:hypothetical protein
MENSPRRMLLHKIIPSLVSDGIDLYDTHAHSPIAEGKSHAKLIRAFCAVKK